MIRGICLLSLDRDGFAGGESWGSGNQHGAIQFPAGYFSIHIVIIRGAEIIPADPEELSSTFRAEMRPWRRGTTTAGVLQKELLAAFRTTVSVHPGTNHAPFTLNLSCAVHS